VFVFTQASAGIGFAILGRTGGDGKTCLNPQCEGNNSLPFLHRHNGGGGSALSPFFFWGFFFLIHVCA